MGIIFKDVYFTLKLNKSKKIKYKFQEKYTSKSKYIHFYRNLKYR